MALIRLAPTTPRGGVKLPRASRPKSPLLAARSRTAGSAYRAKLRNEMLRAYGALCACCRTNILDFLTLQVDGGPPRENAQHQLVALKRAGWPRTAARLKCWNCLLAEHRRSGECPHVKIRERLAAPVVTPTRIAEHTDGQMDA